jgi:hypothetical protein
MSNRSSKNAAIMKQFSKFGSQINLHIYFYLFTFVQLTLFSRNFNTFTTMTYFQINVPSTLSICKKHFIIYGVTDEKPLMLYLAYFLSDLNESHQTK